MFAPLVFAEQLGEPMVVGRALAAFAGFCLIASAVYVVNDIVDWREDREHLLRLRSNVGVVDVQAVEVGRHRAVLVGPFGLVGAPVGRG